MTRWDDGMMSCSGKVEYGQVAQQLIRVIVSNKTDVSVAVIFD